MRENSTALLTKTAMLAALVCFGTMMFKIPIPATNGYTHLGDCMIFIAVLMVGWKRGALAGAVGAAMADLLGGYAHWMVPTFFIKGMMAITMGLIAYHLLKGNRFGWFVGAIFGGIVQIIGYTTVKVGMIGLTPALMSVPTLTMQTIAGIVIAGCIVFAMNKTGAMPFQLPLSATDIVKSNA